MRRVVIGLGLATVVAAHAVLPEGLRAPHYALVTAGCLIWMVLAGRWRGHGPLRGWWGIVAGLALWLLADGLWYLEVGTGASDGLTASPADVVYAAGYLGVGWGLLRLSRVRTRGDRLGLTLDTAIVAIVSAFVVVELLLVPALGAHPSTGWASWAMGLYPVLDVVLLALAARLFLARTANVAAVLTFAAVLSTLAGDLGYVRLLADDAYVDLWVLNIAWIATYALFALAATSPSVERLAGAPRQDAHELSRLAIVGAAVIAVPVLAVEHGATTGGWTVSAVALALLTPALVVARGVLAVVRDRQAQQAIRRAEHRIGSILQQSSDLITLHAADASILHASPASERILGVGPEALVGRAPFLAVHPDDVERLRAALTTAGPGADGPASPPVEYRLRTASGAWRIVESLGTRLSDTDDEAVMVVTTRDVTDRHRAAEEMRFQADLLAMVGEPVLAVDGDGLLRYWNPSAERTLGHRAEDVLGRPALEVLGLPRPRAGVHDLLRRLLARGTWSGQMEVRRADGTAVPVLTHLSAHLDADGQLLGAIASLSDITDLKAAERELEQRAAQQAAVAALGEQALRASGLERVRVEARRAIVETLGITDDQVAIVDTGDRIAGDCPTAGLAVPVGGRDAPHGTIHVALAEEDLPGHARQFLHSVANVVAAAAEHDGARDQLEHLALHDPLTGLPNRTLLLDRLDHVRDAAGRHGLRFAVLMLDLDGFKLVNDGIGHGVGDALLRSVAHRLLATVRTGDTVARLGGDEFAILCAEVADPAEAEATAARIQEALRPAFRPGGSEVVVTASIGSTVGDATSDGARLLREAEAAMYRAKDRGRDRLEHFDTDLQHQAQRRLDLAAGLRGALDRGEIEVHYQPFVDLRTGRVVGAEALARWGEGPSAVSPGEFIPLAEETGLIIPLGAMVLERACRDAVAWVEATDGAFLLSVNCSPRELMAGGLHDSVHGILQRAGMAPERLHLELTETDLPGGMDGARLALDELKRLGIRLAVDDFGTGYSSLASLRSLPFDVVKVDRSFVAGVCTSVEDRAIVSGALELARQFGLTAISEGVETEEQRAELLNLGGELGQGFLWSPAVPATRLTEMLHSQELAGAPRATRP